MKKKLFEEKIHLNYDTIKAEFDNIKDFKTYWKQYSKERSKKYKIKFSKDELMEVVNSTTDFIKKDFLVSDKIVHYDNFDVAPEGCGREFVLLVSGNNIKESILIKMS